MFLLSFANHENIIRLIGLHKANNDRDIYLVFEYMEIDLHNVIKKGNLLKDIHKVFIMYQLFKAIKYIHSGNVIHRDLKPSNVLLNTQCQCKIADFGLARSVTQIGEGDGETGSDPTLTDYVATRWYRAPEILVASKRYTKGIDMWSLGCILGEMLLGKPVFPGSSTINQVERIMGTLPSPSKEDLMSVCAGYGTNLLEKTPNGPRRSLRDILPNVSEKALHLISNLIVFNPNRRLTAVEALEHPYVADFHKRNNEPERGSSVVPLLRDDVQLSVDEYRNKLYSMMDEKHRKHKNMSKSRIRRLSEHIRKETAVNRSSPVIGQGDGTVGKCLVHSYQDLRKERCRSDVYEPSCYDARAQLASRKTTRQPQIDSGERITKTRTISTSMEPQTQNSTVKNLRPTARSVATQYTYHLMNGNASNLTPSETKSCLYINKQHRQLSKSQRSIQSDQVPMCSPDGKSVHNQLSHAGRPRARKNCKQVRAPARFTSDTNWREDRRPTSFVRDSPQSLQSKYFARPSDSANCCYLRGGDGRHSNSGSNATSNESLHASCKSKAIQKYFNEIMPTQKPQKKCADRPMVQRNSAGAQPPADCPVNGLHRSKNPAHSRSHVTKHPAEQIKWTPTSNKSRIVNHYSQSHGIITASAYKDLRSGNIRW
ncbi:uncharacterized protein LOC143216810 isoform X2 [Lasioglossum baleicum]